MLPGNNPNYSGVTKKRSADLFSYLVILHGSFLVLIFAILDCTL
nr:MAG TPA: hypothetical protein [Caudoviricetes sp.]